jgi:Mce-associated membrane protein
VAAEEVRENAKPEIEGPSSRSADCPGCVCLRLASCPTLALRLAFGAGYLKWQDSSARHSQMAGVQSVHAATDGTEALLSYGPTPWIGIWWPCTTG